MVFSLLFAHMPNFRVDTFTISSGCHLRCTPKMRFRRHLPTRWHPSKIPTRCLDEEVVGTCWCLKKMVEVEHGKAKHLMFRFICFKLFNVSQKR